MAQTFSAKENAFFIEQGVIMDAIDKNANKWGLDPMRILHILKVKRKAYEEAHEACLNKRTATRVMIEHRNVVRADYQGELTKDAEGLKSNPNVSDEDLDAIGIAHGRGGPLVPPPTEQPLLKVDISVATWIKFLVLNTITGKLGKPRGAKGARLRIGVLGADPNDHDLDKYRIDAIPTDAEKLPFWTYLSNGRYILKFLQHQSGLKVVFSACWVNTVGDRSPWSAIMVVVVP
jgi:hypothetical protein